MLFLKYWKKPTWKILLSDTCRYLGMSYLIVLNMKSWSNGRQKWKKPTKNPSYVKLQTSKQNNTNKILIGRSWWISKSRFVVFVPRLPPWLFKNIFWLLCCIYMYVKNNFVIMIKHIFYWMLLGNFSITLTILLWLSFKSLHCWWKSLVLEVNWETNMT